MESVSVAHIQHDFTDCITDAIEKSNEREDFFINVDKSLNEVKEFRIGVYADPEVCFDAVEGNSFARVSSSRYTAVLEGKTYNFETSVRNLIGENIVSDNVNLTTVDVVDHPEKLYLLGGTDGTLKIFDSHSNLRREFPEAHASEITRAKFFPSGVVILSASTDMRIKLWSVDDGSNPRTFVGHTAKVTDLAMIGKGRNFLSSSTDGTIRLWECGSGQNIHTFTRRENRSDGVTSLALISGAGSVSYPNNNDLEFETECKIGVAAHESGVLTVHDIYTKEEQLQLPSEFMSRCNSISPNSTNTTYIYAGYETGHIATWDLRSPALPVSKLSINEGLPINHIFYNNGNLYVSSGPDTSLRLPINSEPSIIASEVPTFLVSNDCQVAQYTSVKTEQGTSRIIAVGNWGLCAEYNESY